MRFRLLNAADQDAISMSVYYPAPQRVDIYANSRRYVEPKNRIIDPASGKPVYAIPQTDGQYHPDPASDVNGANYFDRLWREIYVLVKGAQPIDLRIADVIIVSMTLPAMTVDEFFNSKNVARNVAALLGLDESKVRLMNPIPAPSSRRKRSATMTITFEIGDPPSADINATQTSMIGVNALLIEAYQTGRLADAINTTVQGMTITYAGDNSSTNSQVIRVPSTLHALSPVGTTAVEMNAFSDQPKFRFKDKNVSIKNMMVKTIFFLIFAKISVKQYKNMKSV